MCRMGKGQILTAISLVLLCLWVIAGVMLSLFANGWLYSIEHPAPIISVDTDTVTLEIRRHSLLDMSGICSNELQCANLLIEYGAQVCPLESGDGLFLMSFSVPEFVEGPCVVRGMVEYEPVGRFGPQLSYHWHSETFELIEE